VVMVVEEPAVEGCVAERGLDGGDAHAMDCTGWKELAGR
jgi:hypothetical protein